MLLLSVSNTQSHLEIDEAVNLTSEKHDPYTQKVTYTKEENKNTL